MRVSRITEEKYQKLIALSKSMQDDAAKLHDPQARTLVSAYADLLHDMATAHKLEENPG